MVKYIAVKLIEVSINSYTFLMNKKTVFITGAAGFIGSSLLKEALKKKYKCIIIDKLTYAGRLENIEDSLEENPDQVHFEKVDICDFSEIQNLFRKYQPDGVIHLAAESHVDNSISGPRVFVETNIMGTFNLLEASREYLTHHKASQTDSKSNSQFRFLHVSTDEVFGELGETGFFSESTPYRPHSPYSASKASSDHLVRAWNRTYGLPVVVTNCSNNYGPRQFPEKLIPKTILNAISDQIIPVYGKGLNVRDWIHVDDHSRGVLLAFEKGLTGETYCLGGRSERRNIDVVTSICEILDQKRPRKDGQSYKKLIQFVEDRLGHDARYAIDDSKAQEDLGFTRDYQIFEKGLSSTIDWYLSNTNWTQSITGTNAGAQSSTQTTKEKS